MCRVMAENGMQEESVLLPASGWLSGLAHCVDLGATTISGTLEFGP